MTSAARHARLQTPFEATAAGTFFFSLSLNNARRCFPSSFFSMTTNEQSATIPPPLGADPTIMDDGQRRILAAPNACCCHRRGAGLGTASGDRPDATGCANRRRNACTAGDDGQNTGKGGLRNNATGGAMGARSRKAEGSGAQIERSSGLR